MKPEIVYPEPVRPSEIGYRDLVRIPDEFDDKPGDLVPNPMERFRAGVDPDWYANEYMDRGVDLLSRRTWHDIWYNIAYERLAGIFTFPELTQMWLGAGIESEISKYIEKNEFFLWKISNALWRYGYTSSYNRNVDVLNALRRLTVDLPDFELRLTHTNYSNMNGGACHVKDLYLDAALGLLLYHKGKHVLTVGFAPTEDGVIVTQIQLRTKKGNRFLYHLPMHYVDFMLDIVARAFKGESVWLVDGKSAVAGVLAYYKKTIHLKSKEDIERIHRVQDVYDRPLAAYDRGPMSEAIPRDGRNYVRLIPKSLALAA